MEAAARGDVAVPRDNRIASPARTQVWVALDPMPAAVGPLEYVPGSQRWGQQRLVAADGTAASGGSARQGSAAVRVASQSEVIRAI